MLPSAETRGGTSHSHVGSRSNSIARRDIGVPGSAAMVGGTSGPAGNKPDTQGSVEPSLHLLVGTPRESGEAKSYQLDP